LWCKDPVTEQLKFPSGEVTIQHTADNFLLGEGLIAYHYLIFFFMFPIEGETTRDGKNISTIIFLTEEFDYA
jgi:hypothetical protein